MCPARVEIHSFEKTVGGERSCVGVDIHEVPDGVSVIIPASEKADLSIFTEVRELVEKDKYYALILTLGDDGTEVLSQDPNKLVREGWLDGTHSTYVSAQWISEPSQISEESPSGLPSPEPWVEFEVQETTNNRRSHHRYRHKGMVTKGTGNFPKSFRVDLSIKEVDENPLYHLEVEGVRPVETFTRQDLLVTKGKLALGSTETTWRARVIPPQSEPKELRDQLLVKKKSK